MQTEIYSGRSGRRVAETQSDAFHALTVKDLTDAHFAVLALFTSPAVLLTRYEIAERLDWVVGTACGRTRELIDANRLVVRDKLKVRRRNRNTTQQLLGLPETK